VLCAPISRGNRVFGVLELVNAEHGGFGEADLAALAYLAHQAALWLDARERAAP
jgi:GAF domain-containing protein